MNTASATASLMPSGRSSGPERLELRLDRLGLGPRPRVPARHRRVAARLARAPASPPAGSRRVALALARAVAAAGAARVRARARSAPGADTALQRVAQRPRRGLGVVGLGDRAHDDDPRRAALDDLVHVARVEAADREPGLASPRPPRARRSAGPRPGGPAWSASRAPGRPRGSRRRGPRPRPRPGRARGWSGRRSGPARPRARAIAGGSSSWPTWTPSAPHASTRSGPVVEDEERVVAGERARRLDEPVVVERLVAQLDQVDAAAHRGRDPVPRAGGADEVQAGGGEALSWRHPSGDTMKRQNTGARSRAERAPPGRRPSNLIRVVPA